MSVFIASPHSQSRNGYRLCSQCGTLIPDVRESITDLVYKLLFMSVLTCLRAT